MKIKRPLLTDPIRLKYSKKLLSLISQVYGKTSNAYTEALKGNQIWIYLDQNPKDVSLEEINKPKLPFAELVELQTKNEINNKKHQINELYEAEIEPQVKKFYERCAQSQKEMF